MELWIRSQMRTTLENVKGFCIINSEENNWKIINIDTDTIYGVYKSKKRALEVLDEIQNLLNPMLVFKNCNCTKDMLDNIKEAGACVVSDNAHIEQIQTCIYEMPKE